MATELFDGRGNLGSGGVSYGKGGNGMAGRKTKLKPSHRPKPEDYRGAARRAQEIHDRLKAQGYRFPDSTEIVRQDRDTRV